MGKSLELCIASAVGAAEDYAGELVAASSAQLLLGFRGDDIYKRAYAAATAVDKAMPVGASRAKYALTAGECELGVIQSAQHQQLYAYGEPVRQVYRLLQEAAPGQCLIAPVVYQALQADLKAAAMTPQIVLGKVSGKRFGNLDISRGDHFASAVETSVSSNDLTIYSTYVKNPAKLSKGVMDLPSRYEVQSKLGAGAMAEVYKAMDYQLDSVVALKVIFADALMDEASLARLRSEIILARKISHHNILRTFDIGDAGGRPFISMEYVRGMTLSYLIQSTGKLPYSAGLQVAQQLCAGLQAVHRIGVVHRDIKPSNIILEPNGNVKLMDFGIACQIRQDRQLTEGESGKFIGTAKYASPEQVLGEELDVRSDIYSLGLVLSEIFTGSPPFTACVFDDICRAHLEDAPIPPSDLWEQIPPQLEAIILCCLAKHPEERYASVDDLLVELSHLKA